MRLSLLVTILLFPLFSSAQQKEVVFQKKGSQKTFTVPTYEFCTVRLKNGHKLSGYIENQADSVLHFHTLLSGKGPKRSEVQQVMHDGSLSREERNRRVYALMCPDTQSFAFGSVKRLHFSLMKRKFGGLRAAGGGVLFAGGLYLFFSSIVTNPGSFKVSPAIGVPALVAGTAALYFSSNKNIRPKKWVLLPAKS